MKVLIIGHRGQLGSDLVKEFAADELLLAGRDELPVQEPVAVADYIDHHRPDLILNCSAFHRVDDCEEQVDTAFSLNVFAVRNLALAARKNDAVLVHFSTDYVYDSPRRTPYTEGDPVCPKCIYGASKAAGEIMLQSIWERHFVFRVSGLYGYAGSREKGSNFVETMISMARQGKPIRVVDDQVLTPTCTMDLAAAVHGVTKSDGYGTYHLTNAGQCSWYDFTAAIMRFAGLSPDLTPVTSDAFPTKAKRPNYSVLDNARLRANGFPEMATWEAALERYVGGRAAGGRG